MEIARLLYAGHFMVSTKNSESLGKQRVKSIEKKKNNTAGSGAVSTEIMLNTTGVKIK